MRPVDALHKVPGASEWAEHFTLRLREMDGRASTGTP